MAPKKTIKTQDAEPFNEARYYRERNKRIISFIPDDIEIKNRIKDAAELDNRNVNSWMLHHVLPIIDRLATEQLKKKPTR